ncbi:MAG: hypothetical protein IJW62_02220 [Clostridia bacterium]|nr:hypothetical protein [Clostridia bacterium]
MDYGTNLKFFDLNHRKKVKLLKVIGIPLMLVGAVLLIVTSFGGYGMWYLSTPAWGMLVIGGPLWAVSLSMKVKESDMMNLVEDAKRDFKDYAEDKLNYPSDLHQNSLILVGSCQDPDGRESERQPRTLKSGGLLYPIVTYAYLYIRRDRVTVLTRRLSLCEEWSEDKAADYDFADFDGAGVQPVANDLGKAYAFCLKQGDEVIFSTPVFIDDYTKEAFAADILHAKERRR